MGWLIGWDSKKDVIDHCTRLEDTESGRWETIKHCIRGNNLWTVKDITNKETGKTIRLIVLYLLTGDKDNGWGYKDVSENMGPAQSNCPLSYLELAPWTAEKGQHSVEWRHRVCAYHAPRKQLKPGCWILNGPHCEPRLMQVETVRPFRAWAYGIRYQMRKNLVASVHETREAAIAVLQAEEGMTPEKLESIT